MMNMTEFIEKLKEEIREYLPEDVRGDTGILACIDSHFFHGSASLLWVCTYIKNLLR